MALEKVVRVVGFTSDRDRKRRRNGTVLTQVTTCRQLERQVALLDDEDYLLLYQDGSGVWLDLTRAFAALGGNVADYVRVS